MATAIRRIDHEDRLSLVEHLTELRTRLIVCLVALAVAFGLCLWQNHELLHIVNRPLTKQTLKQTLKGDGTNGLIYKTQTGLVSLAQAIERTSLQLARTPGVAPATQRTYLQAAQTAKAAVAEVPRAPTADKPVTLGVGEPFTTTIAICLFFAFILSLPVILFEIYGFVIPALSPPERRIARPLMFSIPVLFVCGATFGYFVVAPAAVRFFQNFNANEFNIFVQANQYYRFIGVIILAMGLIFQTPVAILGVTRAGIVTPKQLAHNRRYAIVVCAAIAAFLPGDAITLLLETVPLYLLFEVSILLAAFFVRRDAKREARAVAAARAAAAASQPAPTAPPPPPTSGDGAADVGQIINHVDTDLH